MTLEQARELMPLYVAGKLSVNDSLALSRVLSTCPELMDDLRLTLALREALLSDPPQVPPFPALTQTAPSAAPLMPNPLSQALRPLRQAKASLVKSPLIASALHPLRQARDITAGALRLVKKLF